MVSTDSRDVGCAGQYLQEGCWESWSVLAGRMLVELVSTDSRDVG